MPNLTNESCNVPIEVGAITTDTSRTEKIRHRETGRVRDAQSENL